jgi:hypothetical protein
MKVSATPRRVRGVRYGVSLALLVVVTSAPTTAACSGGIEFGWAMSHAGGIIGGRVDVVRDRPDFTTELRLSGPTIIAGLPPAGSDIHAAAGLVCDQSADPGESVLVLFDVRGGDPPIILPLFYVVDGPDALEPAVVADALSRSAQLRSMKTFFVSV